MGNRKTEKRCQYTTERFLSKQNNGLSQKVMNFSFSKNKKRINIFKKQESFSFARELE